MGVCSKGRAVDADLYFQQLERVHEILRRTYPAFVNRNRIIMLQENKTPHTARTSTTKIQELVGIKLLPHPAHNPDLAL